MWYISLNYEGSDDSNLFIIVGYKAVYRLDGIVKGDKFMGINVLVSWEVGNRENGIGANHSIAKHNEWGVC